jgi:hypothetical protein
MVDIINEIVAVVNEPPDGRHPSGFGADRRGVV